MEAENMLGHVKEDTQTDRHNASLFASSNRQWTAEKAHAMSE